MPRYVDWIARLLLGVMALGWLAAPLHFADGEHHWCRAHDQFEHSEDTHSGTTPAFAPNTSHKITTEQPNDAASGEHEACLVLGSIHRQKAALADASAQAVYLPVVAAPIVSAAQESHRSESLLAMAPKHGPPA